MGCWSINSFGNDDALDWLEELYEQEDLAPAESAVNAVLSVGVNYLEAPEAAQALAAAEVILAAMGRPGPIVAENESLTLWINRVNPSPTTDLVARSIQAIDRILENESELHELWQDTNDYNEWKYDVESLRSRLC
jgi:hypothetical protein